MIIPKLYGRLGNQAFQIAAAISHARKMKTSWAIPRVTNDMSIWPNYFAHTVPRENMTMRTPMVQFNEPQHSYREIFNDSDMIINGYFQSEKYWPTNDLKREIGSALGFHCKKKDFIAIHVRRGDYVTQFADKHPPLTEAYYDQAISVLCAKGFDNLKVYSDDIEYCKDFFHKLGWHLSYSDIKDPLTDMRDMYNASAFIIANSTFSLFPALLRLDNPPVIAPVESRWYGPGNAHLETYDLMPERFIKI